MCTPIVEFPLTLLLFQQPRILQKVLFTHNTLPLYEILQKYSRFRKGQKLQTRQKHPVLC